MTPYYATEAGLSISMPEDWIVFTTHMEADDPALAMFSMTPEDAAAALQTSNLALQAMSPDGMYIINLSWLPNEFMDTITGLSDSDIAELGAELETQMAQANTGVEKWDTAEFADTLFFRIWEVTLDGTGVYGLQYFTIRNNMTVNVTLFSYAGESVGEELSGLTDSIMSTLVWDK